MSVIEEVKKFVKEDEEVMGSWDYFLFDICDSRKAKELTPHLKFLSMIESPEGEGGPSVQEFLIKFEYDGEEKFVQFPIEWVSWDGFYYESIESGMEEVFPVEVTVIQYMSANEIKKMKKK